MMEPLIINTEITQHYLLRGRLSLRSMYYGENILTDINK